MNPDKGKESLFKSSSPDTPIAGFLVDAVEISFNAVIALDASERITYWNPAAEKLYGWRVNEALGKTAAELFWPHSTPEEQEQQKINLAGMNPGMTIQGEFHPCHKDGSSLVVEYVARATAEVDGLPAYLTVHQDITRPKRTDEEIARLSAELKSMLDESNSLMEILPVGIWIGNHDCSVITGNPAAYRITGLPLASNASVTSSEPSHPTNFRVFVEGEEVLPEEAPMQKVARTGIPMYNFENEILYPDNTRKTIYTSVVPILNEQGKVQKVIGAFADFTERKHALEQLRLAHAYAEQTADRITRLQKVTEALSEALTPAQVAEVLVYHGVPALGGAEGTMLLLTEDGQFLEMVESAAREEIARPYKYFPVSTPIPAADAVRSCQPVWMESQQEYLERYPHLADQIAIWGYQAAISIPMVDKGRILGVLNLSFEQELASTPENLGFVLTLARQGAQALERARLYHAERQARQSAERAVDRQTRLQQVTAALSGMSDSVNFAQMIMQHGLLATQATGGVMVELTAGGRELRTLTVMGLPSEEVKANFSRLMEPTPQSDCIDREEPVWIRSQLEFISLYPSLEELLQTSNIMAAAVIPLIVANRVLGGIAFTYNKEREFDPEEMEFFLAVARQCAQGLERARSQEALRDSEKKLLLLNQSLAEKVREQTSDVRKLASDLTKAEQRERHRLAHILHEDLQQRIYVILMQLDSLRDKSNQLKGALQDDFDGARKQLGEVLAIMRHLSIDLSPPILRDEGLSQAIGWLASQIQEQHGLQIELKAEGPFPINDEDIQMLLFTCVRELLLNVIEHSGAKRVEINLQKLNDLVQVDVRDDGRGFNIADLAMFEDLKDDGDFKQSTLGLSTLRYRLSLFNGEMKIHSQPGAGTLVTITIPIPRYMPGLKQLTF